MWGNLCSHCAQDSLATGVASRYVGKPKGQANIGKVLGQLFQTLVYCLSSIQSNGSPVFSKLTTRALGIWSHFLLDFSLSSSVKLFKLFLE